MAATPMMHPIVLWAQRKDKIFLTIEIEDSKDSEFKWDPSKLTFKGHGGPENTLFECSLEFNKEIDTEGIRRVANTRFPQFVIPKKANEPGFWPRLLKDPKKAPWVKVDFNRWKDEDESDDDFGMGGGMGGMGGGGGGGDFESMMQNMGGMGGMGGFDRPDLDDFPDSDDEDLPDLEDDKPAEHIGKGKKSTDEEEEKKAVENSDAKHDASATA